MSLIYSNLLNRPNFSAHFLKIILLNISKLEKFFIFNVLIPNNLTKVSEFFGEKLQL